MYRIHFDGLHHAYNFTHEDAFDLLGQNDESKPLAPNWRTKELRYMDPQPGDTEGDFERILPGVFVASERALTVIRPLLDAHPIEYLPVKTPTRMMWIVHFHRPVDVLDREKSEFRYYAPDEIAGVTRYVFDESKSAPYNLIAVPETRGGALFTSSSFRQTVEAHGLSGLLFTDDLDDSGWIR